MPSDHVRTSLTTISSVTRKWLTQYLRINSINGRYYLYDSEMASRAGFTTHIMVASLYSMRGAGEAYSDRLVSELVGEANSMQLESGGIVQPYNVSSGESPFIDVVEFCSVARNLRSLAPWSDGGAVIDGIIRGADFVLGQRAVEIPGGVYKNAKSVSVDVLNASAYACNSWIQAFILSSDAKYIEAAELSISHLIGSFGKEVPGWWVYARKWDSSVVVGPSVAYQATIVALIDEVIDHVSNSFRDRWFDVRIAAVSSLIAALRSNDKLQYEHPTWSRDWNNISEIDWMLASCVDISDGLELLEQRLVNLSGGLHDGSKFWVGRSELVHSGAASPVTTRFRKMANLAGNLYRIDMLRTDDAR